MKIYLSSIKTILAKIAGKQKKVEPLGPMLEEMALQSLRQKGNVIHTELDGFHIAVKMESIL